MHKSQLHWFFVSALTTLAGCDGSSGTASPAVGGTSAGGGATAVGQTTGGTTTDAAFGGTTTTSAGGAPQVGTTTTSSGGTAAVLNCSGPALTGGTQVCASNINEMSNGVPYEVWISNTTTGTNCGTFYGVDAAFKASWSMGTSGDFLARAGLSFGSDRTYDQLGTISADYAYTKTNISNSNVYVGIYGWSVSPLIEFYIVEEWIGWNPSSNATYQGTFSVDDGTYDIYTHLQENQPSIQNEATFQQYFSIRQTARQCGHISVSEHFKKWSELGLTLGNMYEAKLLVEAMGGSGTIDFTTATVTAN